MLDTTREFETPEGVELQLHVAGPVVRACAWIIDQLIRMVLMFLLAWLLSILGLAGIGLMLISYFLVEWFYPVVFEVYRGFTPGKKMFGLGVCHDDGTPISWQASVLRNFLRVVDILPVMYGLGLIACLSNKDFKRLGDMAAGTVVIYLPESERLYNIPERKPLALPSPLKLQEQRSILEFAERAEGLSEARRNELALILDDYTEATQNADKPAEPLFRYANWIVHGGQRNEDAS